MNNENEIDSFATALKELIEAAARFGLVAGAQYGARRPEDWAAYLTLFNAGRAELFAEIQLSPHQQVSLAFEIDGKRHPFLQTDPVEKRSTLQ